MKRASGFTVIEVLVILTFLIVGAGVFISQKAQVEAAGRDSQRKTAINAMYYSLEEVFYEKNGYYPQTINSKTLRAVDPVLFYDPNGIKIGDSNSGYHYDSSDCSLDGKCKSYVLHSDMEREASYEKTSRRS